MNIAVGTRTDVGRVREANEDSYLVEPPIFAVADGMGGHIAGDIASATTVEVLQRETTGADHDPQSLAAALRSANGAILAKAKDDPALHGMGTTCTLIALDGDVAQIAHVGDSRAYLLRDGNLSQVTEDHTLVGRMVAEGRLSEEEAEHHPQRSIITRALGADDDVEVDTFTLDMAAGDRLLICSDGLSSMVGKDEIREIVTSFEDPQTAADRLVDAANEAGGEDNITAIVIAFGSDDVSAAAPGRHLADAGPREDTDPAADTGYHRAVEVMPARRRWGRRVAVIVLGLLLLAGGAVAATRYALSNSWFVGVDRSGVVTIYKGIPDEVAGVSLKEPHRASSIEISSLPEFRRDEVEAGIMVDSLEQAEETLDALEQLAEDEDFRRNLGGKG